jgi:hypothetical protein
VPSGKTEESGDASETFRSFVAGGEITIRGMYKEANTALCYPRVVVVANAVKFLGSLVQDEEMTEDDLQAIAERIMTVDALIEGKEHLDRLGNWEHTTGWAKGRAQSQYVIAGHIMYLYENRNVQLPGHLATAKKNGRFAVVGDTDSNSSVLRAMRRTTNHVQYLMEVCVKLVEAGRTHAAYAEDGEGGVYVKYAAFTEKARSTRMVWSQTAIAASLCQFASKVTRTVGGTQSRWWKLDMHALAEYALTNGFNVPRLFQIAAK